MVSGPQPARSKQNIRWDRLGQPDETLSWPSPDVAGEREHRAVGQLGAKTLGDQLVDLREDDF